MSVLQRPGAPPRFEVLRLAAVPSPASPRVLALARAITLLVGAVAIAGIMSAVMRLNPMLLVASWMLLSLAATGLFALSRLDPRR